MAEITGSMRRFCAGPVSAAYLLAAFGILAPVGFDSGAMVVSSAFAGPNRDNPGRGDDHGNAGGNGSGGTASGAGGGGGSSDNGGGGGGSNNGGGGAGPGDNGGSSGGASAVLGRDISSSARSIARGRRSDAGPPESLIETIEAILYGLRGTLPDESGFGLPDGQAASRPPVIERLDPAFLDELNEVLDSDGSKAVASQPGS